MFFLTLFYFVNLNENELSKDMCVYLFDQEGNMNSNLDPYQYFVGKKCFIHYTKY